MPGGGKGHEAIRCRVQARFTLLHEHADPACSPVLAELLSTGSFHCRLIGRWSPLTSSWTGSAASIGLRLGLRHEGTGGAADLHDPDLDACNMPQAVRAALVVLVQKSACHSFLS